MIYASPTHSLFSNSRFNSPKARPPLYLILILVCHRLSYLFGSHTDLNVGQDYSDYLSAQTRIKKRLILLRNHVSAMFLNYLNGSYSTPGRQAKLVNVSICLSSSMNAICRRI